MKPTYAQARDCLNRFNDWRFKQLRRTHWCDVPEMKLAYTQREQWFAERLAYLEAAVKESEGKTR